MMIKVNLKGGFKTVQEGERVLEIMSATVTPSGAPEKLTLVMKDVADGAQLQNTYNFKNDKSVWAMGMMLSIALGLEDEEMFDTKDVNKLVGIKLLCEISHSEYNDKTYANVRRVISKVNDETGEVSLDLDTVNEVLYSRNNIEEDDDLA